MADNNIDIRVRLQGARTTSAEAKRVAGSIDNVGDKAAKSARQMRVVGGGATVMGGGLNRAGKAAKGLGLALKASLVGGAITALYSIGRGAGLAAREYTEAAKAGAATAAVIKSTGGAARVSRAHVEGLAESISNKTGIDDETIQAGQNMLLTFKNIRNEAGRGNKIFDESTRTLVDLSVAMGKDPKKSAIQLGKALNDPVKGITALTKVGVTFTDSEKARIETLVKSGKRMQAQKMILRELNSEFGGQAAAQAQPMEKLKTSFNNIAESIGKLAAPFVTKGINWVLKFIGQIKSGQGFGGGVAKLFKDLLNAMKPAAPFVKNVLWPAFKLMAVLWGVQLFAAMKVVTLAMRGIGLALGWIGSHLNLGPAVQGLINWFKKIPGGLNAALNWAKGAVNSFIGFFGGLPGRLAGIFSGMWDGLVSGFAWAINQVIAGINALPKIKLPGIGTIGIPHINPWVPGGGKGGIPANKLASGGILRQPGMAMVGERGPELLSLPTAARVDPLPRRGALAPVLGGGVINMRAPVFIDGRQVAEAVGRAAMAKSNRR